MSAGPPLPPVPPGTMPDEEDLKNSKEFHFIWDTQRIARIKQPTVYLKLAIEDYGILSGVSQGSIILAYFPSQESWIFSPTFSSELGSVGQVLTEKRNRLWSEIDMIRYENESILNSENVSIDPFWTQKGLNFQEEQLKALPLISSLEESLKVLRKELEDGNFSMNTFTDWRDKEAKLSTHLKTCKYEFIQMVGKDSKETSSLIEKAILGGKPFKKRGSQKKEKSE
jgi:hypothetical protein